MTAAAPRYRRPGWFTRNVVNRAVAGLVRLGVSVWGARILEVPGRRSGEPRRNPVNLLELQGARYLVSPRGHTQWVRNLRVSGEGALLLGRRREAFRATEVPLDDTRRSCVRTCAAGARRWASSSTASARTRPTMTCAASPPTTRSSASADRDRGDPAG